MMDLFSTNVAYADRLGDFLHNANNLIVNPLITLLFALAVVYFLYGVFEFIANQENEEKKTAGKSHMLYGILGIAIMMGVFGIMNIILRTFNITGIDPVNNTVRLNDYTPPSR